MECCFLPYKNCNNFENQQPIIHVGWNKVYVHNILGTVEIGTIFWEIPWNSVDPFKTKLFVQKYPKYVGFPDGSAGEESTCNAGDTGDTRPIPWSKEPLENETANYSSILAWEIPWTEDPDRLQSKGSQKVRNN